MDMLTNDASQLPVWMWLLALVPALLLFVSRKAENERVERLDREHQQMRADIQSGRWRNQK
jgi:hypothetical protein